jgi:hypothetical protein
MKKTNIAQFGGKPETQNLGVPLVIALVGVNVNNPCNRSVENMYDQSIDQDGESPLDSEEFEPVSDGMYNRLLNTVLDEPVEPTYFDNKSFTTNHISPTELHSMIHTDPYNTTEEHVKKHTRKNRK